MRNCGHEDKKECAWNNANYDPAFLSTKSCYGCNRTIFKNYYLGEQRNSDFNWNIHHINSNPKDNRCENLVATHPECNQRLG